MIISKFTINFIFDNYFFTIIGTSARLKVISKRSKNLKLDFLLKSAYFYNIKKIYLLVLVEF